MTEARNLLIAVLLALFIGMYIGVILAQLYIIPHPVIVVNCTPPIEFPPTLSLAVEN